MTELGRYQYLAQRFNEQVEVEQDKVGFSQGSDAQHEVVKEEFEEYIEAYESGDFEGCIEEMVDVLVTIFIQADRMGVDIGKAYNEKMYYNLAKSGQMDEDGKVVDDVAMKKPVFEDERFIKR